MSERLSTEELKRILQVERQRDGSISPEVYEQARTAGLIDEDGFETF